MIDNWRKYSYKQIDCEHDEEAVELYTDYSYGFYWKGSACKKCMMIIQGRTPFEDDNGISDVVSEWA